LRQFPKKMWCYRPSEDRWSIHDLVIQLAESEAIMYINCWQLIAEPGSTLIELDSQREAVSFVYFNQDVRESLKIISELRKSTYKLLCALPNHTWNNIVIHPREGSITLDSWMRIQERGIPVCIEHMQSNYNSWVKTRPTKEPAMSSNLISDNSSDSVEMK
jgi:hypothetical protein